ncbi:hypothetical protein [Roseateles sp.]|uniref:hypothetical protein n=1 Tax=Roseateles sp. TaxID=1971397 RepID=UPI00326521CE
MSNTDHDRRDEESAGKTKAYWLSRPMAERLAEVERLRLKWLAAHDPGALDEPMRKVFRVIKRNSAAD